MAFGEKSNSCSLVLVLLISVLVSNCGTTDSSEEQLNDTINGTWRYLEPGNDHYLKIDIENSDFIEYEQSDDCFFKDKFDIEKVEGKTYKISSDDYSRRGIFEIENGELSTNYYNEDYNFVRDETDLTSLDRCN